MRLFALALGMWWLIGVVPMSSADSNDVSTEPTRMFPDPLLPSSEEKAAMNQAAARAAEEFFQQASAASAQINFPIWLKAQSRKRIDAALAVLTKVEFPNTTAKLCGQHQAEIERSARLAPFSLALVSTALKCAEFGTRTGDPAQLEKLLQARITQMMAEQRGWYFAWPIRVLHFVEVRAWLDLQGVAWRIAGTAPCPYVECLIRSVDLVDEAAGTHRRYYFDISTDYLGGQIGDRSSALAKLEQITKYFDELEQESGFNNSHYFSFIWPFQTESDKLQLLALLREQLKETDFAVDASIALVNIAVRDRTLVLQPQDLAPIETAAAEKHYDAIVALATVHAFGLTDDADFDLARSLLNAANRVDLRGSAAAAVMTSGTMAKRDTQPLFPALEKDARESRLLALYYWRLLKNKEFSELAVRPNGEPLSESLTTFLESSFYTRWRFNDFAKQRMCRYADLGMTPARNMCITLLKKYPLLIESQRMQAMRLAKFQQIVDPLMENDQEKMTAHCLRAAQENLRYGDPDRALMWRYSCHLYDANKALMDSLQLYLRGANVSKRMRKVMNMGIEQLTRSGQAGALLAEYFQAPSRETGQTTLNEACANAQLMACKLLILQKMPWDFTPSKEFGTSLGIAGARSTKEYDAKALLASLEASAVAARGRGIRVHIRTGSAEKSRHFGTDHVQFEPFLVKEVRPDGTLLADAKQVCSKQRVGWHCRADNVAAYLLPASSDEISVLHSELTDVSCEQGTCQRLTVHYVPAKATIAAYDFSAHFRAIRSFTVVFESATRRPISSTVQADDTTFFYTYDYDRRFSPTRLPARCQDHKPVVFKTKSGQRVEVAPEGGALCRF